MAITKWKILEYKRFSETLISVYFKLRLDMDFEFKEIFVSLLYTWSLAFISNLLVTFINILL